MGALEYGQRSQSSYRRPPFRRPLTQSMGMEHRWGRRQPTSLVVHLFAKLGTIGTGRVLNVSSTGAYLETRVPLRLHSLLYLEPAPSVSVAGNIGRVAASVVRRDALGVGLEWCEHTTARSGVNARLLILSGGVIDADTFSIDSRVARARSVNSARTGEQNGRLQQLGMK
jgi:hypothetical protein